VPLAAPDQRGEEDAMQHEATATTTTPFATIPFLRYEDATAAVRWLVAALDFAPRELHPSAEDVQHAELQLGHDGLVMLGPAKEDALGLRTPRALGRSNQGIALVVDDPDAQHARALAAGAAIVRPLADTSYGTRDFTCCDPEGHLWTIGTYRPAGAARLTPYLQVVGGIDAIEWLQKAFGFEPSVVVPGPDGRVVHAELRVLRGTASGLVMLASHVENDLPMAPASRLGAVTQGIYVPVLDVDAHHRRAVDAGARIVHPLTHTSYASREYTCRDPEGNLWSFGSYLA
jgi:uncharacterized glyoxalase superfamily protein PhnB